MGWIQTYTGKHFYPLQPRAEDIDIHDIAHSLSLQCRFNGHCRDFYSVAEHSVRVARTLSGELALWGLLHDAAEAYISDLPRPLKKQMPMFEQAEDRLLEMIVRHFGLGWPMPPQVKAADDTLLATECRDLLCPSSDPWRIDAKPLEEVIVPVTAERGEQMFLACFKELCGHVESGRQM